MKSSSMMRSVMKGLSWRSFAALDTMVVTMAVMFYRTGRFDLHAVLSLALGIVGMELVTKTALFTVHERIWERERKPCAESADEMPVTLAGAIEIMDAEYAMGFGEAIE